MLDASRHDDDQRVNNAAHIFMAGTAPLQYYPRSATMTITLSGYGSKDPPNSLVHDPPPPSIPHF